MRGCLTVLVGGVLFLAILAWFVLPPLAGGVVLAGLTTSGLSGTGTRVVIEASSPYQLLDLHADGVEVRSSDVTWRGIGATALDIRLAGVDLGARTARTIQGRLDGVSIPTSGGSIPVVRVDLDGRSSAIEARLVLDAATTGRLASRAVEAAIGVAAPTIKLLSPDRVVVTVGSTRTEGRLLVDAAGAVVVDIAPLGRATVAQPASDLPLRLRSVTIGADGGATLVATVDPRALSLAR